MRQGNCTQVVVRHSADEKHDQKERIDARVRTLPYLSSLAAG
jgi:hypothetical protein